MVKRGETKEIEKKEKKKKEYMGKTKEKKGRLERKQERN